MSGSPTKRARRMGLEVPNKGDRPPKYARARARARELTGVVPADPELARMAKYALLHVMKHATDYRDVVAASRAMLDGTKAPARPPEGSYDQLSDEELRQLVAQRGAAQGSHGQSTQ